MHSFFSRFLFILILLFAFELWQPIQDLLIIPWTQEIAYLSGSFMQLFDRDVLIDGEMLHSARTGFAVIIRAGCNGVEAAIILIAAILGFPRATLKQRLIGLIGGFFTVQILNIIRIISLYYLGLWNKVFFEWAHLYVWEILIMLDVLIVFLIWLRWIALKTPHAE
jgi:exosortase H (IPTLxxWG-CTERM-specific)